MVNLRWLLLSAVVIIADQAAKALALTHLSFLNPYPVIPSLNFTLAVNKGAAFSFLSSAGGWQNTAFIIFGIIICIFILIWFVQIEKEPRVLIGLSLVLGGAVGNLCDRFRFGYVIDFIDVYVKHWHWPVFNLADTAICIGVGLLILDMFINTKVISKE